MSREVTLNQMLLYSKEELRPLVSICMLRKSVVRICLVLRKSLFFLFFVCLRLYAPVINFSVILGNFLDFTSTKQWD